jgi:cytidylate kinase
MPGITISAGYGAGGSVIAPAVAARLELPLLDRAISATVAEKLQVSLKEAQDGETKRTFSRRFLSLLAPLAGGVLGAGTDAAPAEDAPAPDDSTAFREQAEAIMREALLSGAVILGRAGAAALRAEPDVLRVRLYGPHEARIARAARSEGIDVETARERFRQIDDARDHYIWRLYKVRSDDPELFTLQIDSTVLAPEACVDIIVAAYRSMRAAPA